MRIAIFEKNNSTGIAVSDNGPFHGLCETDPGYPGDLDSLLGQGSSLAELSGRLKGAPVVDLDRVRLLPPVRRPGKILCVGLNYDEHVVETGYRRGAKFPEIFARFASSLIGHKAPIAKPPCSDQVDYEGELVVVIGRGGRNIPLSSALDHVAGYSIFNDVSIRDFQLRVTQWIMGKNFDGTGPFGPWLVTPDQLPPGGAGLAISTRLNGEIMQQASTSHLIFDVPALIEFVSQAMTLAPGDLIVSGTPGGVGMARQPQVFMKPGDLCEIEIEGVGLLSNVVAG
jgi:2-keto-4-pentenoate hydratase/2-oxohepta-3-ene-1,7-dioic acid hydratase in catechol pathway